MTNIHTFYRRSRRLGYFNTGAAAIVEQMRRGALLRMGHTQDGVRWWLTPSGKSVSAKIAAHVLLSPLVTADSDALFSDCQSQTYRYRFSNGNAPTRSVYPR